MNAVWRRRIVHDMLFGIEGSGWHPPELSDSVGWRWSGPGHLSVLRVPAPGGAGRGEAQIVLTGAEPIPDVAIFLNGHRLAVAPRRVGAFAVLAFAWDQAVMAGEPRAEFWFHAAKVRHLPAPGQGMRAVGFRLASLTLEAMEEGPPAGEEALALVAGRRFLAEHLPVAPGRAALSFHAEGAARRLEMRLAAARIGATPFALLPLTLRASDAALELRLGPPGLPPLAATLDAAGDLVLPAALGAREMALLARFLAALPAAFAAWMDEAMARAAPDAELLAFWRRALARLARAAGTRLALLLADGPDPFAADPAAPFAWPGA